VSIFDQFSHVCVYHHNGSKWEKQGFEGTMFLYERYVEFSFKSCNGSQGSGLDVGDLEDNLCFY
jgi:hypothetical protein